MSNSLRLTSAEQVLLKRLYEELKYALTSFTLTEYKELFLLATKESFKSTLKTKIEIGKKVGYFAASIYNRYKTTGIKNALQEDFDAISGNIRNLPSKVNEVYYNFISKNKEEKIEIVSSLILYAAIVFAAGGGPDFEGGIPDLDMKLAGIDVHRNIFTHSIFVGLTSEFVLRFAYFVLEKVFDRLPDPHHFLWDRVEGFLERNKKNTISALWIGIGIHLIQDAGLFASATKPYSGIPFIMPMEAHQAAFAVNGGAAIYTGLNAK